MGMKGFSDTSDKSILFQNSSLPSSDYLLGTEFLLQKHFEKDCYGPNM